MTPATQPAPRRELPILFKGEMVRAILAGTKTQTRRVVMQRPRKDGAKLLPELLTKIGVGAACPYGQPGDRLWVRETWMVRSAGRNYETRRTNIHVDWKEQYSQRGGVRGCQQQSHWVCSDRESDELTLKAFGIGRAGTWRPSIFMPRWASRIDLEIAEVRVQRLQDITEEDAKAEGIDRVVDNYGNGPAYRDYFMARANDTAEWFNSPIDSFRSLWDSINDKRGFGWSSNPWVWCVSFRRVRP